MYYFSEFAYFDNIIKEIYNNIKRKNNNNKIQTISRIVKIFFYAQRINFQQSFKNENKSKTHVNIK